MTVLLNEFITGQIPGMRYFPLVDHFIMVESGERGESNAYMGGIWL